MDKCAPGKQFESGSCFTIPDLKEILINIKPHTNVNKTKLNLLNDVNNVMEEKYNCSNNDQICWLRAIKNIKDGEISLSTIRPKGPSNRYEWLSTSDINQVMIQYMNAYKDVMFYGALPLDFDILDDLEVNSINFDNLIEENKTKLCMVINLDKHDMPGSHWVALYSNIKQNQIYFFDSFAKKPNKRIIKFIRYLLTYMYNTMNNTNLSLNAFLERHHSSNEFDVRFNKIQHQFKDTECGVYSMNFLIRLIEGETFDEIVNTITLDDEMNENRKVYFRNTK